MNTRKKTRKLQLEKAAMWTMHTTLLTYNFYTAIRDIKEMLNRIGPI